MNDTRTFRVVDEDGDYYEVIGDPMDALNSAYRERAHLVALLAAVYPSHISRTDPTAPDWAVTTLQLPTGQAAWHISVGDEDLFQHVEHDPENAFTYDGHSTEEKYARIDQLTDEIATAELTPKDGFDLMAIPVDEQPQTEQECAWHELRLFSGPHPLDGNDINQHELTHPDQCRTLPPGAACWAEHQPFRWWWPTAHGTYRIRPEDVLTGGSEDGPDYETTLRVQVRGEDGEWFEYANDVIGADPADETPKIRERLKAGLAEKAAADAAAQDEWDGDVRAVAESVLRLKRWLVGRQANVHPEISTTQVRAEPYDRTSSAYTIAESDVRAVVAALEARDANAAADADDLNDFVEGQW